VTYRVFFRHFEGSEPMTYGEYSSESEATATAAWLEANGFFTCAGGHLHTSHAEVGVEVAA
jgi:hypothetical protein